MASQPVVIPDSFDGHLLRDFSVPAHYAPYVSHVLLPHQGIVSRVAQLAQDVHAAYQGRELQLVCVLKGAHPVLGKRRFFRQRIEDEFDRQCEDDERRANIVKRQDID